MQFEVVPETLNDSNEAGQNDSDIIEVVDVPPGQFRRSTRTMARSNDPSPVATAKKREKRMVPLSARSKAPTIFREPTKRAQRAAAQRAALEINKSLEDTVYEFNDFDTKYAPQRKKPQSPVSTFTGIGSMKKVVTGVGKGRKLWSKEQDETESNNNNDSDDDEKHADNAKKSPMKRRGMPKINKDVELTPTGLRKSICRDPELQKSQILKNASRINEDVKRIEGDVKRSTNTAKTNEPLSGVEVNIFAISFQKKNSIVRCALLHFR